MLKKIFLWFSASLVALSVTGFLFLKFSKIPEPPPEDSLSASWSKPGDHEVAKADFTLRDANRETQQHDFGSGFEGLPYREFQVTVRYPKRLENSAFPVIVHSHGFMSERNDLAYILDHLSSRGYVVVAADYPLTKRAGGDSVLMADVVNQPADVRFILDQITDPSSAIGKELSELVDENRVGLMGYSLGGLTSTLTAYHPEYHDPRIKAVVSIAGPSAMLDDTFYRGTDIPFLMVAGTADEMVPFEAHAAVIPDRISDSILVEIDHGSHLGFAGMSSYFRWLRNPDSLTCWLMNMKMDSMGIARGTEEKAWYPLIGSTEQGVIYDDPSMSCNSNTNSSKAMNPLTQQVLTRISTVSFFESIFNTSPEQRKGALEFLLAKMPEENNQIRVTKQ